MTLAVDIRKNLFTLVDAYMKATGESEQTVSRRFYGNANFLTSVRAGTSSVTIDRLDKLVSELRAKWPANKPWPYLRPVSFPRR